MTRRTKPWVWVSFAALLGVLANCEKGPTDLEDSRLKPSPAGLHVSEPVFSGEGVMAPPDAPGEAGEVYVSAEPGSFPGGVSASVTNSATGASVEAAVVDGGFDPVTIQGEPGQELQILVQGGDGSTSLFKLIIPNRRPPKVVRTRPPKGQTDVVLNASVAVFFSEPVDPASITKGTIQLLREGEPVQVNHAVSIDGLVAQFVPDELLAPDTEYTLVVSQGVRDLSGDPLEEPVSLRFFTETPEPVRLAFIVEPTKLHGNQEIKPSVQIAILDEFGNPVPGATHTVALSLASDPVGGTLSGTTEIVAQGGIATFSDLSIDRPGEGYTLVATAEGLASAVSSPFDVFLRFVSVNAGPLSTCALALTGDAYCWGFGTFGNLGDGLGTSSTTPVLVSGGLEFIHLAGSCGLTVGGKAYCWGENRFGQIGDGTTTDRLSPVPVSGGLSFLYLSSGELHRCGVSTTGEAFCWGDNFSGQLGDGTTTQGWAPGPVSGDLRFGWISGGGDHTCGVTEDGGTFCWGGNHNGQLGDGTTVQSPIPKPVSGLPNLASVNAGFRRSCGIEQGGTASCWGLNYAGQVGDGTKIDRHFPVPVSGGLSFTSISGSGHFTCGLTADGEAFCWGNNGFGQLGNGTTTDWLSPAPVSGDLIFRALSSGSTHTCGITTAGEAFCWGENSDGQLGTGTTMNSLVPVRVAH